MYKNLPMIILYGVHAVYQQISMQIVMHTSINLLYTRVQGGSGVTQTVVNGACSVSLRLYSDIMAEYTEEGGSIALSIMVSCMAVIYLQNYIYMPAESLEHYVHHRSRNCDLLCGRSRPAPPHRLSHTNHGAIIIMAVEAVVPKANSV